jgi:hypothetical protein
MKTRLQFHIALVLFVITCGSLFAQSEWGSFGNLTTARCAFNAMYIGSGKILVIGGSSGVPSTSGMNAQPLASCEIIDIWGRSVYETASMNIPRSEFAALQMPDSNIVVIGGVTGPDPQGDLTPSIELYDRQTNRWKVVGSLRVARRQLMAAFIDDHRILVVGGRNKDYSAISESEIFDFSTGELQTAAPFPFPISDGRMVRLKSMPPLVFGGRNGGGGTSVVTEKVYAYDTLQKQWYVHSSLSSAVHLPSQLELWDGRLLVAAGSLFSSGSPYSFSDEVQIEYHGEWQAAGTLSAPRVDAAMAQWSESDALIVGGVYEDDIPTTKTEWIDVANHECRPGPEMHYGRRRFATVSVPASQNALSDEVSIVAIAGHRDQNSLTPTIELLEQGTSNAPVHSTALRNTLSLSQNYPNPVNRTTTIQYDLPDASFVSMALYNSFGVKIRTLVNQHQEAGYQSIMLDASDLPNGAYLCRLIAEDGSRTIWMSVHR